jgi:hypothetical protein
VKRRRGRRQFSEYGIPVFIEDKFLVFCPDKATHMGPHTDDLDHLRSRLDIISRRFGGLVPIFDLRRLETYYNDIDDLVTILGGQKSYALINRDQVDDGWQELLERNHVSPMVVKGLRPHRSYLSYEYFDVEFARYKHDLAGVRVFQTHDAFERAALRAQTDALHSFLTRIQRHSMLVEFAMLSRGKEVHVVPYHGHAIHHVETRSDCVVAARPAVIANATGAVFAQEIRELEQLINTPRTTERAIQRFLEAHPSFLRGLNYKDVYPQLVLERNDTTSLRPDFILEPFEGAFCDILDVKLPRQKLIVGTRDRLTLAAGIQSAVSQLREYGNYFDEERHRRFVREKYGLRLYKPRLIVLVGRDMRLMSDEQVRRALTGYDNLLFLTFDELLRHARRRLLL